MLLNKIIIVGLLLACTLPVYAYESETGNFTEGEYYSVMFNPDYAYDGNMDNPVWYQPIKDYLIKFDAYFKDNAPSVDMTIFVKKMVWKENNQQYEDTTNTWKTSHWYFFSNNSKEVPASTLDPVKEYFKNNTDDITNFKPAGQGDHPDILNVSIDITSDGTGLARSAQGYVAMTQDDLTQMKSTVGGQDYGFSLEGMGGEGGIGEIYSSVGTGGERSNGMSDIFKYLFYALIPILFILSIINMITKVI